MNFWIFKWTCSNHSLDPVPLVCRTLPTTTRRPTSPSLPPIMLRFRSVTSRASASLRCTDTKVVGCRMRSTFSQGPHRARPRSLAEEGAPHGAPRYAGRVPALTTSPATLLQATRIHISCSSSSSSSSSGGGGGGGSGSKGGPLLNRSSTTVSNGSAPNATSNGGSTEPTSTVNAVAGRTFERSSSSPVGGEIVRPVRPWACMREPSGRGPGYPHNFDANFLNSLPPINRRRYI